MPSCCSRSTDTQENDGKGDSHICACKEKLPRAEAKELSIPSDVGVLVMPLGQDLEFSRSGVFEVTLSEIFVEPGWDPPRWMLSRFSRWLL